MRNKCPAIEEIRRAQEAAAAATATAAGLGCGFLCETESQSKGPMTGGMRDIEVEGEEKKREKRRERI